MNFSPSDIAALATAFFGTAVVAAGFAAATNFGTGVLAAIKRNDFKAEVVSKWVTSDHGLIAVVTVAFLAAMGNGDPTPNTLAGLGAGAIVVAATKSTIENCKVIFGIGFDPSLMAANTHQSPDQVGAVDYEDDGDDDEIDYVALPDPLDDGGVLDVNLNDDGAITEIIRVPGLTEEGTPAEDAGEPAPAGFVEVEPTEEGYRRFVPEEGPVTDIANSGDVAATPSVATSIAAALTAEAPSAEDKLLASLAARGLKVSKPAA